MELGTIDQMWGVRSYTQLLLIFPIATGVSRADLTAKLEEAAAALVQANPYLSGQVQREPVVGGTGIFSVVDYEPHKNKPPFYQKDLTRSMAPYSDLKKKQAPYSELPSQMLTPVNGFPHLYDDKDEQPVFLIQASFIDGGLILCFSAFHNYTDGNGMAELVREFSILCRGDKLPNEVYRMVTVNKKEVVGYLQPGEQAADLSFLRQKSMISNNNAEPAKNAEQAAPLQPWISINFSSASLKELKASAKIYLEEHATTDVPYITTNDALAALVWQSITRVRLLRLYDDPRFSQDSPCKCGRAINLRRAAGISEHYVGNVVCVLHETLTIKEVTKAPLGALAITWRKRINKVDDNFVRSWNTLLATTDDRSTCYVGAGLDPQRDVLLSSFADYRLYECDFGELLGKPAFVRRPSPQPCESLGYFMPKTLDGDVCLNLCLDERDVEALRSDQDFNRYAKFID